MKYRAPFAGAFKGLVGLGVIEGTWMFADLVSRLSDGPYGPPCDLLCGLGGDTKRTYQLITQVRVQSTMIWGFCFSILGFLILGFWVDTSHSGTWTLGVEVLGPKYYA